MFGQDCGYQKGDSVKAVSRLVNRFEGEILIGQDCIQKMGFGTRGFVIGQTWRR